MDRELAARKLSLQFDLDESLPAVLGDRTQIQRVLSYLMAKLFELPDAEQGNSGRILLRTAASDGRYLILDLSDFGELRHRRRNGAALRVRIRCDGRHRSGAVAM